MRSLTAAAGAAFCGAVTVKLVQLLHTKPSNTCAQTTSLVPGVLQGQLQTGELRRRDLDIGILGLRGAASVKRPLPAVPSKKR